MTTSWCASAEYMADIWQAGRRQPLFGGSISAEEYQRMRNGLVGGQVQKEDLTFRFSKGCTDADGKRQFVAGFHTMNEYGEISTYAGVYTKQPEEVLPLLQELQQRYKPGGRHVVVVIFLLCGRLCGSPHPK